MIIRAFALYLILHAQDDLNLRILRMFEARFRLRAVHICSSVKLFKCSTFLGLFQIPVPFCAHYVMVTNRNDRSVPKVVRME